MAKLALNHRTLLLLIGFVTPSINSVASNSAPEDVPQPLTASSPRRTVNPRLHPIGSLFGVYQASVDLGIARQWAIGPTFGMIQSRTSRQDLMAYSYGVTATWAIDRPRFETGWLVRATACYIDLASRTHTTTVDREDTEAHFAFGAIGGRQWVADNGFNFTLGAGLAYHRAPAIRSGLIGSEDTSVLPELEASVGWAF